MPKKSLAVYLVCAFFLAWLVWIGSALVWGPGSHAFGLCETLGMYAPLLAAVAAGRGITRARTGIEWRPKLKYNAPWYIAALAGPTVLTVLGGLLYYLVFPSYYDKSMALVSSILGDSGLTPWKYIGLVTLQGMTIAPLINMLFAVGEEAGWRGFLYPRLRELFGRRRALVVGGVIWGLWHTPLIVLGTNYGTAYPGYPVTGVLLMCFSCVTMGIALNLLYEKSGTVWTCALAHGAVNAVAALPGYVMVQGAQYDALLGPLGCVGLISGLPLTVLAAAVFLKTRK